MKYRGVSDRHEIFQVIGKLHSAADRILPWPETLGERLVDDNRARAHGLTADRGRDRTASGIAVIEEPTVPERDSHRLEVAGAHINVTWRNHRFARLHL